MGFVIKDHNRVRLILVRPTETRTRNNKDLIIPWMRTIKRGLSPIFHQEEIYFFRDIFATMIWVVWAIKYNFFLRLPLALLRME